MVGVRVRVSFWNVVSRTLISVEGSFIVIVVTSQRRSYHAISWSRVVSCVSMWNLYGDSLCCRASGRTAVNELLYCSFARQTLAVSACTFHSHRSQFCSTNVQWNPTKDSLLFFFKGRLKHYLSHTFDTLRSSLTISQLNDLYSVVAMRAVVASICI